MNMFTFIYTIGRDRYNPFNFPLFAFPPLNRYFINNTKLRGREIHQFQALKSFQP